MMTEFVPVLKDENKELPIPTVWRKTLVDIVEAFKKGDFMLEHGVASVQPISTEDAKRMAGNIEDYGEHLIGLPEETWRTSVYLWMELYWEVLIDLYTVGEGKSDLVLFVKVREDGPNYRYEVYSVHVP